MDVLDAGDELVGQQQDGLERELAVAKVEKILQTGSEEIDDHGVVVTFGSKPADKGNADTSSEGLVHAGFILELRVLGLDTLELDGNFLPGNDIGAEIDVSETTAADFTADAVFITDTKVLPSEKRVSSRRWRMGWCSINGGRGATNHSRHIERCLRTAACCPPSIRNDAFPLMDSIKGTMWNAVVVVVGRSEMVGDGEAERGRKSEAAGVERRMSVKGRAVLKGSDSRRRRAKQETITCLLT
jgi:hypothetical protein